MSRLGCACASQGRFARPHQRALKLPLPHTLPPPPPALSSAPLPLHPGRQRGQQGDCDDRTRARAHQVGVGGLGRWVAGRVGWRWIHFRHGRGSRHARGTPTPTYSPPPPDPRCSASAGPFCKSNFTVSFYVPYEFQASVGGQGMGGSEGGARRSDARPPPSPYPPAHPRPPSHPPTPPSTRARRTPPPSPAAPTCT